MTKVKIELKNVYKVFGPKPKTVLDRVREGVAKDDLHSESNHTVGLRDISLKINEGEIFVIIGLSGSGKSTLIRHINRLIDPTAGEILIDNENVMEYSPQQLLDLRRHKVSMVFQKFALFPHKSVLDNVAFGRKMQGEAKEERDKTARSWISRVGLEGYEESYPRKLSGGMQQRVGIARALTVNPDILLLDEPFSALDPIIRLDMQDRLAKLQNELKKTIVFITHDLKEALKMGDRVAILKDGELVQVDTPADLCARPKNDYVKAFVDSR